MTTATTSAPTTLPKPNLIRVYVWELPVRVAHWLIVLSVVVLGVTGYYIGHPFITAPDPAGQHFVMGTVKAIHFFAAIVFTLTELSRIVWMFVGNRYARWDQLIPTRKERWKEMVEWLKFYIFIRRDPPRFVGHNALAGLSYALVYVMCLLAAVTGYALFAIDAGVGSPMRVFSFFVPLLGGAQTVRWIHHIIMWLLVLFIVHHITIAILVASAAKNATIDAMFTGYRFVEPDQVADSAEQSPGER